MDYCPSIKQGDERFRTVQHLLQQSGCLEVNQRLTDCLNLNRKDFSKCKVKEILCRKKTKL